MTPQELSESIRQAIQQAVASKHLALDATEIPTEITVDRPRNLEHGDWATNVALQLAKLAGITPRDFADIIKPFLEQVPGVETVAVGSGILESHIVGIKSGRTRTSHRVSRCKFWTWDRSCRKNHQHRIYFRESNWATAPWTYPMGSSR